MRTLEHGNIIKLLDSFETPKEVYGYCVISIGMFVNKCLFSVNWNLDVGE